MNKNELIQAIAAKTESSKAEAEPSVRALIEVISVTLKKGEWLCVHAGKGAALV